MARVVSGILASSWPARATFIGSPMSKKGWWTECSRLRECPGTRLMSRPRRARGASFASEPLAVFKTELQSNRHHRCPAGPKQTIACGFSRRGLPAPPGTCAATAYQSWSSPAIEHPVCRPPSTGRAHPHNYVFACNLPSRPNRFCCPLRPCRSPNRATSLQCRYLLLHLAEPSPEVAWLRQTKTDSFNVGPRPNGQSRPELNWPRTIHLLRRQVNQPKGCAPLPRIVGRAALSLCSVGGSFVRLRAMLGEAWRFMQRLFLLFVLSTFVTACAAGIGLTSSRHFSCSVNSWLL